MHKYLINNREVTKGVWSDAFKKHSDATVILRTNLLPPVGRLPVDNTTPISVERLKQIKDRFKQSNLARKTD